MKTNPLAFIASRLQEHLPEALHPLNTEIQKAAQHLIDTRLERLDLVPRREFDAQQAALQNAKTRLDALEARLAALQKKPA